MPSESILVVDDEPLVLGAVSATLTHAGYHVMSAGSAEQALEAGRRYAARIDLMVCDVVIPGRSGPSLAEDFRAIHPETRVLFMAGLPDHPEVKDGVLGRGRAFLAKPFMPQDLLHRVRHILDSGFTMTARA